MLYLVLPPIVLPFFSEGRSEIVAHYPLSTFLLALVAALIYFFSVQKPVLFETSPLGTGRVPFFVYSSNALVSFGILCLSSVIFELISYFSGSESGIHRVIFQDGISAHLNFFFGLLSAAFFEEVIYRLFLPAALLEIAKSRKKSNGNRKLSLFCEGISVLLFAAGHLYLGAFGFLNALMCGIALRACTVRTKTIWVAFCVHAAYNALSFAVMWRIGG